MFRLPFCCDFAVKVTSNRQENQIRKREFKEQAGKAEEGNR